jgi:hypothetical protein
MGRVGVGGGVDVSTRRFTPPVGPTHRRARLVEAQRRDAPAAAARSVNEPRCGDWGALIEALQGAVVTAGGYEAVRRCNAHDVEAGRARF